MPSEKDIFLETLFRERYTVLYQYAMRVVHSPYLAEDLVMDTFHLAWERVEELQIHENPAGWLTVVLHNKMGNYLKESKRRPLILLGEYNDYRSLFKNEAGNAGSEAHLFRLAVEQILSPEDYRFLMAHYQDGLQYAQLAEQENISVWNCRKRMERIRTRLREQLQKFFQKK